MRLTSCGLCEDELTILRREVERQELGEAVMAIDASAQDMVISGNSLRRSSPGTRAVVELRFSAQSGDKGHGLDNR